MYQARTDLPIGVSLRDQRHHLMLTSGQPGPALADGVIRFGDIRVVDGEEHEEDVAELEPIPVAQRVLTDPPLIDEGPVAAPQVDQEPSLVAKLQFGLEPGDLGVAEQHDVVHTIAADRHGLTQKLVPSAVRPLKTRHGEILSDFSSCAEVGKPTGSQPE